MKEAILLFLQRIIKDFLLDIKAPMKVCDFINLMKENNLNEISELLSETIKKMDFYKNATIYVDNILDHYTQDTCIYECNGDRDYFESKRNGTYKYSFTDRISQLGLIHSNKRAQDLYIPCGDNEYGDDEYIYIGIILG